MSDSFYLASQSPRRRQLLAQIGLFPALVSVEVDESVLPGEPPAAYVERLARAKAEAGARRLVDSAQAPQPVLGADTTVVLDGDILGKPADAAAAAVMLRRLAGRAHEVLTGVAVHHGERTASCVVPTRVVFAALDEAAIQHYCASGEPLDKAGGYAIQGRAAVFVAELHGSYSGVVGLPLFETAGLLRQAGVAC